MVFFGTFIYQFECTTTVDSNVIDYFNPISNSNNSFTFGAIIVTGTLTYTVSIPFSYTTINPGDGLNFYTSPQIAGYYNNTLTPSPGVSNLKILDLGGVPLSFTGETFTQLTTLISFNSGTLYSYKNTNLNSIFSGCSALTSVTFDSSFDTSSVISMMYMFYGCAILNTITGMNYFTSRALLLSEGMFFGCQALTAITFGSGFNTELVVNMSYMFYNCSNLVTLEYIDETGRTNEGIAYWNTSNVKDMRSMFQNDYSLLLTGDLYNKWNVNKVGSNKTFFSYNSGLIDNNIPNWRNTSLQYQFDCTTPVTDSIITTYLPIKIISSNITIGAISVTSSGSTYTVSISYSYTIINGGSGLTFNVSRDVYNFYNNTGSLSGVSNLKILNLGGIPLSSIGKQFANLSTLTAFNSGTIASYSNTVFYNMFYGCSNLTSVTFSSNFTTSSVWNMKNMFKDCCKLTTIDLTYFTSYALTTTASMFSGCESLKTITFGSGFTTIHVTTMMSMFEDCFLLETIIGVNYFTTTQLATTASMFYACESLKTITFGSEFTTAGVTTMMGMFEDCIFLETIFGINYFTTTQLTTTASMFSGCESLKTITFGSGFTTKKVENMTSMFSGCFSVTTLDLTYFSSTLLLNTNDMFYMPVLHGTPQKSYLMNITFGPNFTCSSVQNMYYMFAYCNSLTALQYINTSGIAVSGIDYWDTSSVQDMTGMFLGDSSLSFTGDLYNKWNVTSIGSNHIDFSTGSGLSGNDIPNWTDSPASSSFQYQFDCTTAVDTNTIITYLPIKNTGNSFIIGGITVTNTSGSTYVVNIPYSYTTVTDADGVTFNVSTSVYDYYNNTGSLSGVSNLVILDLDDIPLSSDGYQFSNLTTLLSSFDNGSKASYPNTNLNKMFYDSSSLSFTEDLYNNLNVTTLVSNNIDFAADSGLTGNDITNFADTLASSSFQYQFDCTNAVDANTIITYLPIKNTGNSFIIGVITVTNTSDSTYTVNIPYSYTSVTDADGVTFNVSTNVYDYYNNTGFLSGVSNLVILDLDDIPLSSDGYQFANLSTLMSFDNGSKASYPNTNLNEMFSGSSYLTNITFGSGFDTSSVKDMSYMFYNCCDLIVLSGLIYFTSRALTTTRWMFYNCDSLTSITFGSSFITENVRDMTSMFSGCSQLENLDMTNFTSRFLTSTEHMFNNCSDLKNITFGSGFTTESVITMIGMFHSCYNLTTLDLKYFTSNCLLDTSNMFDMTDSYGLHLHQHSFLTTITFGPYFTCSSVKLMINMFYYCNSLTTLQHVDEYGNIIKGISYWDTSNVTDMTGMFQNNSSLSFTGDLYNNFKVDKVDTNHINFNTGSLLSGLNIPNWTDRYVSCFLKGTLIKTVRGAIKIELLKKGDKIVTSDNRSVSIIKLHNFECIPSIENNPFIIPKGMEINGNICVKNLYLSPDHCVITNEHKMTPVKFMNVEQEKTTKNIHYYHITLPNFFTDNVVANSIPCESYGKDILKEYQHDEIISLFHSFLLNKTVFFDGFRKNISFDIYNKMFHNFKKSYYFYKKKQTKNEITNKSRMSYYNN